MGRLCLRLQISQIPCIDKFQNSIQVTLDFQCLTKTIIRLSYISHQVMLFSPENGVWNYVFKQIIWPGLFIIMYRNLNVPKYIVACFHLLTVKYRKWWTLQYFTLLNLFTTRSVRKVTSNCSLWWNECAWSLLFYSDMHIRSVGDEPWQ